MRSTPLRALVAPVLLVALAAGCKKDKRDETAATTGDKKAAPAATGDAGPAGDRTTAPPPKTEPPPAVAAEDLDSKDILARTEVADEAVVKHVLIGWKELAPAYGGRLDPRAAARTNAEAAALAREVYGKLVADPTQIDALVKATSEDPGSLSGDPYTVTADSRYVPEFKQLALRLKVGEAGIVKTDYGYHVMERIAPPPPDPLESADILARPAGTDPVEVQHILIGWKDVPAAKQAPLDPRAKDRTKEEADKIAALVLKKVRDGGDMVALMKEYSEDPGTKDNGKTYEAAPDSRLVEPFKKLALRLKVGEAGLVKTVFGWHIIKRVPPPPPDPLESADILARAPVTQSAQVKHILLGWAEVNAGDPRGKARTRAELEALVKKTVAALEKGDKIEPLMKELSEDPGSAANGTSYPVTPDARLVPPFKNLSLRLKVNEVGVVKSQFGIHIIQRVE